MHDWVVRCKSKKGAEEFRSFELSGKEIFSNSDETKSKEAKNKKNVMESGEIFISRFLTSGIEPEARGSIRKYLTTRPKRHQVLMLLWSSGQILRYRTSCLGFDSRSQKSRDKYFSRYHQHPESL